MNISLGILSDIGKLFSAYIALESLAIRFEYILEQLIY